ncbi:MAG: S8 family serine peptidase [Candidatus Hodarchaeota archaeon]
MQYQARHLLRAGLALTILLSLFLLSPAISVELSPKNSGLFGKTTPLKTTLDTPLTSGTDSPSPPSFDPWEKCSPSLKEWAMTGEASNALRYIKGEIAVIVNIRNEPNWAALESNLKILHVQPLMLGYIVYGSLTDPKALATLVMNPDVILVLGDEHITFEADTTSSLLTPVPSSSFPSPLTLAGVERIWTEFPNINGSGVIVGVVDSGVDFGCTDLVDAVAVDEMGRPLSYDPGGSGIALTSFMLPSVGGYLLTEGLDFYMYTDYGQIQYSNSTYGIYTENCYVGGFGGLQSLSGFYRIGMSVQTAYWLPKGRAFFLYTLVDENTASIYDTVYIDFETSWAITAQYNNLTTSITTDWDFTNNLPHRFDSNPVLAEDLDGDGFNDYSMGSLSNTFDLKNQITGDLISGIDPQGRGFAFMFDNYGHGTTVAYGIASQGLEPRDVYNNGSLFTCPGIASCAKIMALKRFTISDFINTWFWGCGYRPLWGVDRPYDRFSYWQNDSGPACDILTNDWNWNTWSFAPFDMAWGYDWYSMLTDYLSVDSDTLFVNKAGFAGPGYGTGAAPYATNALTVGLSNGQFMIPHATGTTIHGIMGILSLGSSGPTPMGDIGPDIVAPAPVGLEVPVHHFDDTPNWYPIESGTSVVAGICALVKQVNASLKADTLKTLIMNGADDLGYDIYRQGAGRVNAYRSVHLAFGNTTDGLDSLIQVSTTITWDQLYFGDRQTPWRAWYTNLYYGYDYGVNPMDYTIYNPSGSSRMSDGKAFPHPIYQGDSVWFNLTAKTGGSHATSVEALNAYTYQFSSQASTSFSTFEPFTTLNLTSEFSPTFIAQFLSVDYAVVHCSYSSIEHNVLLEAAGEGNSVFLFDWQDQNGNNQIDPANPLEGSCVVADIVWSNCHQLNLGFPAQHFTHTPALYYYDIGSVTHLGYPLIVNVTIRLYDRVSWSWVSLHQYTSLESPDFPFLWNVTITAPSDATPGMHEGFIEAVNGTGRTHLPLSIRVDLNMTAPGIYHTWGGSQGTPYDNGAAFSNVPYIGSKRSGDWRFYFVDAYPTVTDVSYVFVNVTWRDPNTCLDVLLYYSSYGYHLMESDSRWDEYGYASESTWECQNVLLFDASHDIRGITWGSYLNRGLIGIAVHTSRTGGTSGGPEEFWITVAYGVENHPLYPIQWTLPTAQLNVSSAANASLFDDSVWEHPHVTLSATWDSLLLPEFPTIYIRQTELEILRIYRQTHYGTIQEPVLAGWHPDHNPREAYDYAFLQEGDVVQLSVEFGTWSDGEGSTLIHGVWDDCDIFVWQPGVDQTWANSLVSHWSHGNPEVGSFVAPVTGNYTIGIDYYSGVVPMGWYSEIYAWRPFDHISEGQTTTFDTASIDLNQVCDVRTTFLTGTSLDFGQTIGFTNDRHIRNVTIKNFFPPVFTVLEPDGGEILGPEPFRINWTVTDENVDYGDESLHFSVELSNDAGFSWKVIEPNTTQTSLLYEGQDGILGITPTDMCLVRVNASDGMYTVSRTSSSVFTILLRIGGPPLPWELLMLITGLVFTSAFIVVLVVLIIHLQRKSSSWKKIA